MLSNKSPLNFGEEEFGRAPIQATEVVSKVSGATVTLVLNPVVVPEPTVMVLFAESVFGLYNVPPKRKYQLEEVEP